MTSSTYKSPALVLQTFRWSESSKIVHLFTREKGYERSIAKGALRPKSPFRGILEPLVELEVIISVKESRELQILQSASLLNAFMALRTDLKKLGIALAYAELIRKLLKVHEPIPDFYDYTIANLGALEHAPQERAFLFLWHFLLHLSAALGFGWKLDRCLVCGKPAGTHTVHLDAEQGGWICSRCQSRESTAGKSFPAHRVQHLHRIQQTPVTQLLDLSLPEPGLDLTPLLLKHLMYHTDTSLELKSLKWFS